MKYKRLVLLLGAVIVVAMAVGCGMSKTVTIYSNPPGAKISIDGKGRGPSPVEADLPFSSDSDIHTVAAQKEGYKAASMDIYYQPYDKTEYTITLSKQETIPVELVELGPSKRTQGAQVALLRTRATVAYVDDSDPCPNSSDLTNVTRYSADGPFVGAIAVSPRKDSEGYYFLVYDVTRKDPKSGLLLSNLLRLYIGSSAKEDHLTRDAHRNFGPALDPTGTNIIYSSQQLSSRFRLWSMSVTGEPGPKIYGDPEGDVFWPDVSPSGKKVVFTAFTTGTDHPRVWTVNDNGTLARALDEGEEPKFNPAGGEGPDILYVRYKENSKKRKLWIMSFTGRLNRLVTQSIPETVDVKNPGWSPDGKWVVFASDEGQDKSKLKNWDIWIMRASDGAFRTRLTENGSLDDLPVWGKDGYIYFRSNRGGIWNIWRLKPRMDRVAGGR